MDNMDKSGSNDGRNEQNMGGTILDNAKKSQQLGKEDYTETASKYDIEEIFLWKDDTSKLFENGQFGEAFGVLEQRNRLGEELRDVPLLLKNCECLMAAEKNYEKPKQELKQIMQGLRPSAETVLWLGNKLKKQARYFAAFIVYEIFYEMFHDVNDAVASIEVIESYLSGLKGTISTMVKQNDSLNIFVRRHILPKMYEIKNSFLQIEGINPQYKCVKYGWITHAVEICETDSKTRRDVILETIAYMEEILGERVVKHQIFSTLCNNLGSTFLMLGSNEEAIHYLKKAIECIKSATDFQREEGRKKDLMKSERALRGAQGLEESIGVKFETSEAEMLSKLFGHLF